MSGIDFSNMKEIFIDDTAENIEVITDKILASEQKCELSEEDAVVLMRLCHSIKGASRMLKLGDIAEIFHNIETLIKQVTEGKMPYEKYVVDLILEGMDEIRAGLEKLKDDLSIVDFPDLQLFNTKLEIMVAEDEEESSPPPPPAAKPAPVQTPSPPPASATKQQPSPPPPPESAPAAKPKPVPAAAKPKPVSVPPQELDTTEPEENFSYDNMEQEILGDFIEESAELVEILSNDLVELEADPSPQLIDKIFRAMHTLKGSAGFVELTKFQELAHTSENILDDVRNEKYQITTDIITYMLKANDVFSLTLNLLGNGQPIDVSVGELLGQLKLIKANQGFLNPNDAGSKTITGTNILADAVGSSASAAPVAAPAATSVPVEPSTAGDVDEAELAALLGGDSSEPASETPTPVSEPKPPPAPVVKPVPKPEPKQASSPKLKPLGKVSKSSSKRIGAGKKISSQTLRVELTKLNNLMNLVGELVINKIGFSSQLEKISEYIDEIEGNLHHINLHLESADLKKSLDIYEKFQGCVKGFVEKNRGLAEIKELRDTVKSSSMLFGTENVINKLYENWKTMVVEYKQISIYYIDLYKTCLTIASKIGLLSKDLQENVMQTRMLPISNVFNKYKRTVRDLSNKMNKKIQLEMEGEDTEMDKNIIEKIGDPLTHIIRNSIDHGIEFPEERVASGKPEVGTVNLRAYNKGDSVIIEIEDDGKGIDAEKIASLAVKKGLITTEKAEMMNESEKLNLLFAAGFSTAEKVTEISGRGVGMDVVKENLSQLKGLLDINTEVGKGTKMTIKLPLTLAILQVLQVKEGNDLFAIPSDVIAEVFSIKLNELEKVKNIYMINNRGRFIPAYFLYEILGMNSKPFKQDQEVGIVIVGIGDNNVALITSEIVKKEEVVIKNLGDYIKNVKFVSGATIEGDSTITLILNITEIIDEISNKSTSYSSATADAIENQDSDDEKVKKKKKRSTGKRILVVEDSTTTRKLICSIIESGGYEVAEAVDGIDGVEKMKNEGPFRLATVDVKMPRLNGYGFTKEIRKIDEFKKFPIVMISTRDLEVDKERGFEAGIDDYIVKPFEPAELLSVIKQYVK